MQDSSVTPNPVQTISEKLRRLIIEQLGVDAEEVTPEASFSDDLGCDSLDLIEIVMACEETFEIEIPDEAAEKLKSVKDAVAYLEERLRSKAGAR